ncbi:TPA: GNAT family N-acetyltransferase [Pseudomonas putida]|uniref:GNAT family N-acetyltransferase n=1 Tax=Pseudomonas putida TaxID=303 RepID=UPI002363AD92|nr:GNAT family N-acetyltransferase [Pseudomonas putida]MDD2152945.1 GNAT family N-acetyltransferase [Pseudomonas putida]HDS1680309.1 GNAT family N-acetyltransferase [Pseudomonas putida]
MRIRPAQPDDIAQLIAVERSAAHAFARLPDLAWLARAEGLDEKAHKAFIDCQGSWLAEDDQGQVLGFVCLRLEGQALHIHELSVRLASQGQGIGRQLLDRACAQARHQGAQEVTLTTFAQVSWNGPFYARYGFEVLDQPQLGARLQGILATERAHGLTGRCAMRLPLA